MLKIIFVGANSTVSSDGITHIPTDLDFCYSWSLHLTRIPNICYIDKIHIQNTDKLAEIYTWQKDNWHFIRFTCSGIPDKPRFWEKTLTTFLKVYISMFFFSVIFIKETTSDYLFAFPYEEILLKSSPLIHQRICS